MASNHAAPILTIEGNSTTVPTSLESLVHVMVVRTDRPSLRVAACGAHGPFARVAPFLQPYRYRSLEAGCAGEWVLSSCKRCDRVVDAHLAMIRRVRRQVEESLR